MKKYILFFFLLSFGMMGLYAQCPMCKTALSSNRKGHQKYERQVGGGINKGILFLLSAPYILAAGVGVVYYNAQKKKKLNYARKTI